MLNGLRILDLTWVLGGPFAGQLLAQLGAEVIKIEPPEGDPSRNVPIHRFDGDPAFFMSVNRGKRGVSLDLKHPEGKAAFYDLVRQSDGVLYGFAPDVPARLGLDFETLSGINPRICVGQLIGIHDEGEYVRAPAYDLVIQAQGGFMSMTGNADGPPVRGGYQIADLAGGLYLALGLAGALAGRGANGKGSKVQVSLLDCQLSLLTWQAQNYFNSGVIARAQGSRNPTIAPSEAFACKDGRYIAISPTGEQFWTKMCEVIGKPELPLDPRFNSRAARLENVEALVAILQDVFSTRTADEWYALFTASRVPASKVLNVAEAIEQPVSLMRRMVEEVQKPGHPAPARLVGNPFKYEASTPLPYPPAFGSATREVFASVCGYSSDRLDELVHAKALFDGDSHDKTN